MTKTYTVEQTVSVTVDKSKFTPAFMQEFQSFINDEDFDEIDDHMAYLAELYATGAIRGVHEEVEGYGKLSDMGIKLKIEGVTTQID